MSMDGLSGCYWSTCSVIIVFFINATDSYLATLSKHVDWRFNKGGIRLIAKTKTMVFNDEYRTVSMQLIGNNTQGVYF